jgi:hypothetical protein
MADRAIEILRMNQNDYATLSEVSHRIADGFRWEKIAAETIDAYSAALARLGGTRKGREIEAISA